MRPICDGGATGVADQLSVSSAGLNLAAVNSANVADALTAGTQDSAALGGQPSHAGVAALDAALARFRIRQSERVSQQGADMRTGSAHYESTDRDAADDLTRSV